MARCGLGPGMCRRRAAQHSTFEDRLQLLVVTGASLNELALRASVNSSTSARPSGAIRLVGLACRDGDVSSGSLVAARLVSRAVVANLKRDRVTNFSLLDYPALTGPRSIWDARFVCGGASLRSSIARSASKYFWTLLDAVSGSSSMNRR
jgi:hypothetical protein